MDETLVASFAEANHLVEIAYDRLYVRNVEADDAVARLRRLVHAHAAIRHEFEVVLVMLDRRETATDHAIQMKQLGERYLQMGQLERAEPALTRALTIMELRNPVAENIGWFLLPLVDFALARGRPEAAAQLLDRVERVWKWKYDAPRREIEQRRERIAKATVTRLRHPKLGPGTIVARDGEKVRLRMDDGSERVFLMERLQPA